MRLSNKYGGLQFFAPAKPHSCTMYFDSHISKVYSAAGEYANYTYTAAEWTQSGQSVDSNYDYQRTYVVTLDSGYVIDTVTIDGEGATGTPVIADDGLSFFGTFSYGSPIDITITSKLGGASTMSKSYDLSTSTKWANLADGEHTVKLRAKGTGYGTSSFSNSVTVTKGATGETWHLNDTISQSLGAVDVQFTCAGIKYNSIDTSFHDGDGDNMVYYRVDGSSNPDLAYGFPGSMLGNNVWNDQKYRTITFQTPPTGALLTWLQANGTKQGGGN